MDALGGLGQAADWEYLKAAPNGYAAGTRLVDVDGQVCQVWWGGIHEHPHAVFTGESSPSGADALRSTFPGEHTVARADVCIDYAESGAYDRIQVSALAVAKARKVKVGTAGDHLLTMEGRTLYLGAKTSHTRMRLYDKAAQLRGQFASNPAKLLEVPNDLARLEVQVRPQTPEAKARAAEADPVALMGSAKWTRELMMHVAGLDLAPFAAGRLWRQADDDRAYYALLAQYGGMLGRLKETLGSWDCVGLQIGDDLAENARIKRGLGR